MGEIPKNRHAVVLGRKGGRIGGKRRLETMTPEARSESARKAALAMHAKRREREADADLTPERDGE